MKTIYDRKYLIPQAHRDPCWYERLLIFTAGAFLFIFGYIYIMMFTYSEPLIKRADMKWEAYYKGFYKGTHFGDEIIQKQNKIGDFMYIVRPDKSVEYVPVDYDYRPIRIKGD